MVNHNAVTQRLPQKYLSMLRDQREHMGKHIDVLAKCQPFFHGCDSVSSMLAHCVVRIIERIFACD